jgi:uncharacterized protein YjlB
MVAARAGDVIIIPVTDPVYGENGPLIKIWERALKK